MFEFTIINKKTNEERIIFGRNEEKAFQKANLSSNNWVIIASEYVD